MFAEDPLEEWTNRENWQRLLSNKHNSREFAQKFGCAVPGNYWRGRNLYELDFECLPDSYVIKPTLGYCSNHVFLMNRGVNLFDGKTYGKKAIISALSGVLEYNPRLEFLVEEFITNEAGEHTIPVDYKFYTFNGEIACVRVINRRGPKKGHSQYYKENWKPVRSLKKTKYEEGDHQEPPQCFEEMRDQVKVLSKAVKNFMRIDFYATKGGPVFGEFSSTPSRGVGYTRSGSDFLIKKWDGSCKGLI